MKDFFSIKIIMLLVIIAGCNTATQTDDNNADKTFENFEPVFLDAYWKHYPGGAIYAGYGKYYETLVIPGAETVAADIAFCKAWTDSLNKLNFKKLSDNNKISFNIIKNQLEANSWYATVFKSYEWDASIYNVSGECDYIINQPYAPLDERLKILHQHLQHVDEYYKAALHTLHNPVKEYIEMAILQNQGGASVFGNALTDSIRSSHLSNTEKDSLAKTIVKTISAMNGYVDSLKTILADKNYSFRSFRIGKELYKEKFKYDLAIDLSPEEIYQKAVADKQSYHAKMATVAKELWTKYYASTAIPTDTLKLVQMIFDKIQLQHAAPKDFFDSLTSQVHQLKRFIVEKKLFDFDTANPPVKVRLMPEYARGFSVASAEFTLPYQKTGTTWYNIDDITVFAPEKAEGILREYNNYASQLLSIHEAIPGHCLQGIYNTKKSPDVLRSVFQNGAMVEGWAVYTEDMMIENGWGNNSAEMLLVLYKLKLRELANVIIDYDIQCLNKPREDILHLLVNECFQTSAQAEEKYHRATVSQVQLCSYYAGAAAIHVLRDAYKKKVGDAYNLKDFHEKFLSFGSSPVKYISERMLQ